MNKIAKVNKKNRLLYSNEIETLILNKTVNKNDENIWKTLFKSKQDCLKFIGLLLLFNTVSLNYIGIAIGITTLLEINPYLIFILSSFFEFVGILVCFLNDRLGRKKALFIYLFIVSFASVLIAFLTENINKFEWILYFKLGLFLLARTMVSSAFNTSIIYTAELYEIKNRNTAITIISSFGFLVSLFSPQINALKVLIWNPLPYLIYAFFGIIACAILLFLPETLVINSK
jgi:MFS family permease